MNKFILNIALMLALFSLTALCQNDRNLEREKNKNNPAEKRIALVIGNGTYTKIKGLPNVVSDSAEIARTLKELGFEVLSGVDLNKKQMESLIREFGTKLNDGGTGLFYFAGHGIQTNGENFLVPVDAEIPEEDEISYNTVPLNLIFTKMTTAKNDLNIVILDASHKNPFAQSWRSYREGGNYDGLAKISPPSGTYLLFSAEPGKLALSPVAGSKAQLFTEAFLKNIKRNDFEYQQIVKAITADVWERSNRQQLPWKEGNSAREFYFVGSKTSESVAKTPIPETQSTTLLSTTGEQSFWQEAERKNTIELYEAYIANYPKGDYVALARVKISGLKTTADTNKKVEQAKAFYLQAINETNDDRKIELFTKAIELIPEYSGTYKQRGLTYVRKKNYELAIADFNKAIELNSQDPDSYQYRGLYYHESRDYDRAISDFSRAIYLDNKNIEAYIYRGVSYQAKKDYSRGIEDFNKALSIDPRNSRAYYRRGVAFNEINDFNRAVADFNSAIELEPQIPLFYYERGQAYYNYKDFDKAIIDFSKAVSIDPKYELAYYKRGVAYRDKKEFDRAISDLTKAIELYPQFESALVDRGNTYSMSKEYEKAIADFTKVLELNPKNGYGYWGRAIIYFYNKKDYDRTINECTKALEIFPGNVLLLNLRGDSYYEKKEYSSAVENYTKAIDADPTFALTYYNRGYAYEKMGRKDLAQADRRKYKELKKD